MSVPKSPAPSVPPGQCHCALGPAESLALVSGPERQEQGACPSSEPNSWGPWASHCTPLEPTGGAGVRGFQPACSFTFPKEPLQCPHAIP